MANIERMAEISGSNNESPQTSGQASQVSGEPKVIVVPEDAEASTRPRGLLRGWFRRPQQQVLVKPGEHTISLPEISPPDDATRQKMERIHKLVESGVTASGGQDVEVEVRPMIEDSKSGNPGVALVVLEKIDNLEAEEREKMSEVFREVDDILAKYAHNDHTLGLDKKITALEDQLKNGREGIYRGDKNLLESITDPDKKNRLPGLLDSLDATEEELKRLENTLKLQDTHRDNFTEKAWKKLGEIKAKLEAEKQDYVTDIQDITGIPEIVEQRIELKKAIHQGTEKIKDDIEQDREDKLKELWAEPEPWEKGLREELSQDKGPVLAELNSDILEKTFSDFIKYIEDEQKKPQDEQDRATLDHYEAYLASYFYEARSKGIFDDLDERLGQKYEELATKLYPHIGEDEFGRRRLNPAKTFPEVKDDITEFFDSLMNSSKPQYIEHPTLWSFRQRRGLTSRDRERFDGIRAEFAERARIQMEDSLSNLYEVERRRPQNLVQINRVSGEWDVNRLEESFDDIREMRELERGSEQLFREETAWKITLLGQSRRQIELGAVQAASNIERSAATFTLEVIRERMSILLRAIEEKTNDLKNYEKVSKDEAEKMIDEIKRSITNEMDFFILDWLGSNLKMAEFSGYLKERMTIDGTDKLKIAPAMNDGLTGLAIIYLLSPKFRLYHRPQGFKGQIFDDDTTHKYIRGLTKDQIISLLMEYELEGIGEVRKRQTREKLMGVSSESDYLSYFVHKRTLPEGKKLTDLTAEEILSLRNEIENLSPSLRLEIRRWEYNNILQIVQELKNKKDNREASEEEVENLTVALKLLRNSRKVLAGERNKYQEAKDRAESAFMTADRLLNIFGESAEMGGPFIVMENGPEDRGDYVTVGDATLFYKYAILQVAKDYGEKYGAEDNAALIRWRSRMWIDRWKKAGLDRKRASRDFSITLRNGQEMEFKLKEGFEETGLTEDEWKAFEEAVKELREKGYTARFRGERFEDIIQMDFLKPVMNNFLIDYKSSESQINSKEVIEQVAMGRLIPIKKIRERLGLKGRQRVEGNSTQDINNQYTQMVEDSRALDAELERLTYFVATHGFPKEGEDPRLLPFSADRIDYGYQRPWGENRSQRLKAFWYTNLRRTVPRAVDLIHAMPFSLPSLSKWLSFDNILELIWNLDKMESVDNPALTLFAESHRDAVSIRAASEGGTDLEKGRRWGFLEKPLVDANSLWELFATVKDKFETFVQSITREDSYTNTGHNGWREKVIEHLWNGSGGTLGRFAPIIMGTDRLLGEDRQALSSGAAYEENEKFALRFLEWLISTKNGSVEQGAREEGGVEAYNEVANIIKVIVAPDSYRRGSSLWDEVWRKFTPGHNPRLPFRAPQPTYVV